MFLAKWGQNIYKSDFEFHYLFKFWKVNGTRTAMRNQSLQNIIWFINLHIKKDSFNPWIPMRLYKYFGEIVKQNALWVVKIVWKSLGIWFVLSLRSGPRLSWVKLFRVLKIHNFKSFIKQLIFILLPILYILCKRGNQFSKNWPIKKKFSELFLNVLIFFQKYDAKITFIFKVRDSL